jgi:hypothetical protein
MLLEVEVVLPRGGRNSPDKAMRNWIPKENQTMHRSNETYALVLKRLDTKNSARGAGVRALLVPLNRNRSETPSWARTSHVHC